jgi:lysophospholipase L1-like esterase
MKTRAGSLAWLLIFAVTQASADDTAFTKWEKEITAIEAKIQSGESQQGSILFVGSSSIRLWDLKKSFPDRATSNHGFGGSQMADSVHFFERIVAPIKPSVIVVYAGDNDIAQKKTPRMVDDDFAKFVAKVEKQLPDCRKVIFVAIKPSLKRWALADTIKATNQLIQIRCKSDERLHYLDIWTPMLGADEQPRPELLLEDGLHMNNAGYQIWNAALEPLLN